MSVYKCQGPGVKSLGVSVYGYFTYLLHNIYLSLYPSDKYDLCPNWGQGLKTRFGS